MKLFILTSIFYVLGAMGLNAQNVMFFSSKQGLSNSRVRNITEDSRHNIWVTTQNGLNRFDGVKMNVYHHEFDNPSSLLYDESICVLEYEKDKMLVGTAAGVQWYDYATDKFTTIPYIQEGGDTLRARVVSLNRIQKNRVMVCFAGYGCGELKQEKNGQFTVRRTNEFDIDGVSPVRFYEDARGTLWVINGKDDLYRQKAKGYHKYGDLKIIRKLCETSSGTLYAATYNQGVFVYDRNTDSFRMLASKEELGGAILGINPWTEGRLFISTDGGGVCVYDEHLERLVRNVISVKDFDMATSNVTNAICDSFGNVWVAVYMKGVVMKPINQSAFSYIGQNSIPRNTIGKNSIFAIASANAAAPYSKGIWASADNDGLYLVSADGMSSKHWNVDNTPGIPHAFTTIYDAAPSAVLMGTFYDGLWQMKDGRFSCLSKDIDKVFEIRPAAQKDCYWIATIGEGFFYYQYATGKYISYKPDVNRDIIGNPYVYTVLLVKDKLFVGTADGMLVAYPDKEGVITKKSTRIPGHSAVRHLAASPDGQTVWAATNEGLVKMDYASLKYRIYTTADGLPVNSITSVCVDGTDLWMGTDFGLSCLDTKKDSFTNFFVDDGLQDNEFSRGAVFMRDGTIYLSGIGGITYFDTKSLKAWQGGSRSLRLRLVDVLVDDKAMHKGDKSGSYDILEGLVDECGRIDLCHTDNHFTLELCVEGLNNQHVTYEYSIDGGKWMDQGGNSSRIIFDNLQPGTYHIKVRAHALGSVSEERELVAVVHPAWYASVWAKVIYFLLFLALCWFVYEYVKRQMRLRRIMERNRQQRELNETRIQFFMNISHEIRTPMTLILAPLERMIGHDKDPERQRNYLLMRENSRRILRLINQMMDVRKIEQGKFLLDYHPVELVEFLQNIYDVFAANAQSRNIDYTFVHEMDRLQVYVDPDNMDKIVMNLLSNAFKFTPDGGKVTLQLIEKDADFEVRVADSGVGIPDDEKQKVFERFYSAKHQNGYMGTGIGLNLTSLLVRLHKGTITIEDNPEGQGTLFIVNMPVGDESLRVIKQESLQEVEDKPETEEMDTASLLNFDRPADTHRRNALLVEDDEAIRQYVQSELSSELVVQACANGQEAWDYIVSHPGKVDIVVSDIMMPVMDGMTLCQKLKSNFNTNHIPIVLVTALGSDADRIVGISNGADAYVSKPFNIDVLRTTILQLLKTRQILQGKYHGDKQQEEHIDKVEMESPDENLMKRVMKVINENMDNPELSVEVVADKVGISRVHFYRKMKDLTGQSPRDFVKYVRLKEAARLLAEKDYDITGVSVATGFKSLSAFSTSFKALYGLTPSEWVKQHE
ncbi:MAG: response regulator [Bacteroidaceae bacterium]|nr:response regulator [Bacteroidaceae bacterium]